MRADKLPVQDTEGRLRLGDCMQTGTCKGKVGDAGCESNAVHAVLSCSRQLTASPPLIVQVAAHADTTMVVSHHPQLLQLWAKAEAKATQQRPA